MVINNLKNAFPEKTEKERSRIIRGFYHYFSDLVMESVKMSGMKENDFRERLKIRNPELLNKYFNAGKSVVVLAMHYNNWEWGTHFSMYLKHKILAVYKPLHNKEFDRYMIKTRSVKGTELIKNNQILRRVIQAEKNKEPVAVWLASDQTPPAFHTSWYLFLNQEAMFYPGPALLSKQFNLPLFFQHVVKTGRGKYESVIELITENPAEMSETEMIKTYIRKMEEVISHQPAYYLWSHRRWKHKRPEETELTT